MESTEREAQLLDGFRRVDADFQDHILEMVKYAAHGWERWNCDKPCSKGRGDE
jgi:hypothetical protein